jgi:hypothetical protein
MSPDLTSSRRHSRRWRPRDATALPLMLGSVDQAATSQDRPQTFRDRAAECLRLVENATTTLTRETFLYLATRWRALAEADKAQLRDTATPRPADP